MSKQDTFRELFQKFLDDQKLTVDEIRQLRMMVQDERYREQLDQMLAALYEADAPEQPAAETSSRAAFEEVWSKLQEQQPVTEGILYQLPQRQRRIRWWYAAAAVVLAGIPLAYYFLQSKPSNAVVQHVPPPPNDILPGGNQAVLTLADGSTILLDKAGNGVLSRQGSTQVVKLANGQLAYKASGSSNASTNLYNTIATPRGGKFQVTLPDGTKVWLNAASSLRYPASFTGPVREVTLTGEAYFEVAPMVLAAADGKKGKLPFRVIVNYPTEGGEEKKSMVEVLGTHFNVNAYAEEPVIKTTLLEGSVKVSAASGGASPASRILKPGQQAQLQQQQLAVVDADTEAAIAWKNGLLQFEGDDIQAAMRMIARSYDVTVEYNGTAPSTHFRGTVSSNGPVSKVLDLLEQTGEVHFEIKGRKIIVTQ